MSPGSLKEVWTDDKYQTACEVVLDLRLETIEARIRYCGDALAWFGEGREAPVIHVRAEDRNMGSISQSRLESHATLPIERLWA